VNTALVLLGSSGVQSVKVAVRCRVVSPVQIIDIEDNAYRLFYFYNSHAAQLIILRRQCRRYCCGELQRLIPDPKALVAVSKGMRTVNLCTNKILQVLNWRCRLTQVDLYIVYNGRKTVVVVVVVMQPN